MSSPHAAVPPQVSAGAAVPPPGPAAGPVAGCPGTPGGAAGVAVDAVGAVDQPCGPGEPLVRAAGGVIWRSAPAGEGFEVVVVHRPRYDDWSLPKGKLEEGESDEEAAAREVEEETGVVVSLGAELPATTYIDRSGRTKRVRYWAMTVVSGTPAGASEVDDARWVPLAEARRTLSYERDAELLDALVEVLTPGG